MMTDYILCFFIAVMKFRADAELDWVDSESFAKMYLAGRAKSTFSCHYMDAILYSGRGREQGTKTREFNETHI